MFYPKNSHDSHSPESTGSVSLIIAELAESSSYVTEQHIISTVNNRWTEQLEWTTGLKLFVH